jgi:hypothetical protein
LPTLASTVFNSTDMFKFDIEITAQNCPSVRVYVIVQMGETWDKPVVELKGDAILSARAVIPPGTTGGRHTATNPCPRIPNQPGIIFVARHLGQP